VSFSWIGTLILALLAAAYGAQTARTSAAQPPAQPESLAAFQQVLQVLRHPRCMNCHVPGNQPLQGDDRHAHTMNVKRGVDGKGTVAMRCSNCHQLENSTTLHAPPGATDWQMPPAKTPMAWSGLSDGDLCRAIKDPEKNGHRTLPALIPHMDTSLVTWAWNPGPGRTSPPLSHDEFVNQLKRWIHTGAACPQ